MGFFRVVPVPPPAWREPPEPEPVIPDYIVLAVLVAAMLTCAAIALWRSLP